jgi:hypothetical protein
VDEIEHTHSTTEADAKAESAVLRQVLALHPTAVTLDELP